MFDFLKGKRESKEEEDLEMLAAQYEVVVEWKKMGFCKYCNKVTDHILLKRRPEKGVHIYMCALCGAVRYDGVWSNRIKPDCEVDVKFSIYECSKCGSFFAIGYPEEISPRMNGRYVRYLDSPGGRIYNEHCSFCGSDSLGLVTIERIENFNFKCLGCGRDLEVGTSTCVCGARVTDKTFFSGGLSRKERDFCYGCDSLLECRGSKVEWCMRYGKVRREERKVQSYEKAAQALDDIAWAECKSLYW